MSRTPAYFREALDRHALTFMAFANSVPVSRERLLAVLHGKRVAGPRLVARILALLDTAER